MIWKYDDDTRGIDEVHTVASILNARADVHMTEVSNRGKTWNVYVA
jgi:hypothetical protein